MSNSGAKSALRGYRLQTLYILNEILNSDNENLVFQPEGNEDLAVYEREQLIRIVQIKAYSEPLVLSNFKPQKKDSFFHRVSKLIGDTESTKVEVVSFGDIGEEISKAWAGNEQYQKSINKKLTGHGFTSETVQSFFNKVAWQRASEQSLMIDVHEQLNKTLTAGSPDNAFSLLTSWLYFASENQSKITSLQLFEKISSIGKYLAERKSHHKEWYSSIEPLYDAGKSEIATLKSEYYRGVSTRLSHIQENLDVERKEYLRAIEESFEANKTVIIHGASGQGKTSLAYRYLLDHVPEDWRFQIKFIESRQHAISIALAIADHLAAFNASLYLYIDVTPRDLEWTSLVKSLLDRQNVKILISIREEDLARQNISNEELGFPKTIQLNFGMEEAEYIYSNLVGSKLAIPYPTFNQAWLSFGGKGALLEYIYFLTQTESLEEKLKHQVQRIRTEVREGRLEPGAINLLMACAVATAFESRLRINSILSEIKLNDPVGTFELFENEYLLRRSSNNIFVEALHPIRSKILASILTDSAFNPWISSALTVLPCLSDNDLESFLLHSFALHPDDFDSLISKVFTIKFNNWAVIAGICRTILWFGIRKYAVENDKVINEAIELAGNDGWQFLLLPDIGRVLEHDPADELISLLGKENPTAVSRAKELRTRISDSDIVFEQLKIWLNKIPSNIKKPESEVEMVSLGEVLLWSGRLKSQIVVDLSWLKSVDFKKIFLSIEPLAELLVGLYYFDKDIYQAFVLKYEIDIENLFQKSTNTMWLEQRKDNVIAHYIVPFSKEEQKEGDSSYLNDLTGIRASLLRKIFPDKSTYGAKGYGHQNILFELPFDESDKPGILKTAIPIDQFVSVNSTWANFADYVNRPDDWYEYGSNILNIREQIVDGLSCMIKNLNSYFKKRSSQALVDKRKIDPEYWESLSLLNRQIKKLPKVAVDPWGLTSESTKGSITKRSESETRYSVLQSHSKIFRKALNNYVLSICNFFSQSHIILIVNGIVGRLPLEHHQIYFDKLSELGHNFTPHNLHLSTVNFNDAKKHLNQLQQEFRNLFKNIVFSQDLNVLEKKETEKFNKAWPLWYQFTYHPEMQWKDAPDIRAASIEERTKKDLFSSISRSLSELLPSYLNAYILNESLEYEGKKALWVAVEIESISSLDNLLPCLVEVFCSALRPLEFKDLKYFVMSNLWENIIFVPVQDGVTFSNLSWVIIAGSFVGEGPVIDEEKPYLYIPRPLCQKTVEHLGLVSKNSLLFEELSALEIAITKLFSLVNHMHCFAELVANINEVGVNILQSYFEQLLDDFSDNIEQAENSISQIKSSSSIQQENLLISLLDICEHAVQPYEVPEDKQVNINLSDSMDWANLLHNALTELQLYKWQKVI